MDVRVGLGHDVHRLAAGRKLILGGVIIEHPSGPVGHSDADVLLHALTDALLGAAGLGDIGQWFPNTDQKWADADSAVFVQTANAEVRKRHWAISNVDCTIFAERPKLSPYKRQIEQRLAELLEVPAESVNVKAKTGERVGPIGREEAIAADVVVLLCRTPETTSPGTPSGLTE